MDITKFGDPQTGEIYYRYQEPAKVDYSKLEKVGVVYKGFLLLCNYQFLIYSIRTVDDKEPPLPLQSNFTSEFEAKEAIDTFLKYESIKQKAFEKARKNEKG